ncbi:unnamed protein product [Moneuplotes crassus]|uniref:J domain-containing protein n=1 Tax=Euplotes crassus TaxID=5936 RepID=A0AAD1UNY0_EUPCR|nr:unnamed protein product [Moneuplotes crassus]
MVSNKGIHAISRGFRTTFRTFSTHNQAAHKEEKDYYKILGVKRDASQEKIRENYLKLAKKYHPDTEGGDGAIFKLISEAHTVLSDKFEKDNYDISIGNFEGGPSIYSDIYQKDYKYKKETNLTEAEKEFQEQEHIRILERKHKREQKRIQAYMDNFSAKGTELKALKEQWTKEYEQLKEEGRAESTLEDYLENKMNEEKENEFDYHAHRRRQLKRSQKLNFYSFKFSKFYQLFVIFPLSYMVYLYIYEKNDLERTAREFTAFRHKSK